MTVAVQSNPVIADDDFGQIPTIELNRSFENLLAQDNLRLVPVESSDRASGQNKVFTDEAEGYSGDSRDDATDEMDAEGVDEFGEDENENGLQVDRENEDEEKTADRQRRELALTHLLKLRKPISEIRIGSGLGADDKRPPNQAGNVLSSQSPGLVAATGMRWQAPSRYPVPFWHRPLYYQQPNLERCGRTFPCAWNQAGCWQNAVSGFTFLVNTMVLPYRMATECPDCLIPHQGDCRTCATTGYDIEPLQPGRCGWVSEAAAIAGFTFLLL